jgi:hypothetical protein
VATLRVISGPAAGTVVEIDGEVVVGREGTHLAIEDSELSRKHVVLRPAGDGVEVEDLRSTNGTVVDGRRLEGRTTVRENATIEIGGSRLAVELAPPASSPASASATATGGSPAHEGPSVEWGIRGAVLAVVAAICAVLIAAETGGGTSSHRVDVALGTAFLDRQGLNALSVGSAKGTPFGQGAVTIDHVFHLPASGRPFAPGVPMRFSGKVVLRYGKGSIVATLIATTTRQSDNSSTTTGTGTVVGGAGKYDDASGSFKLSGSQAAGAQRAALRLVGTLKY